jgi:hypothetical protein
MLSSNSDWVQLLQNLPAPGSGSSAGFCFNGGGAGRNSSSSSLLRQFMAGNLLDSNASRLNLQLDEAPTHDSTMINNNYAADVMIRPPAGGAAAAAASADQYYGPGDHHGSAGRALSSKSPARRPLGFLPACNY